MDATSLISLSQLNFKFRDNFIYLFLRKIAKTIKHYTFLVQQKEQKGFFHMQIRKSYQDYMYHEIKHGTKI